MMEAEEELSPVHILSPQLPDGVVDELLEYLDFFALQTLRLVCKTTKEWVETPEVLRRFVVRIIGKARLDEVLRAPEPVPWNNFAFTEKCVNTSEADVQRFLAAYGDKVRELTVNWRWKHQWPQLQLRLLLGCSRLESLRSIELYFDLISNELANKLLENWKNLRHFHVEIFNGSHNTEPGPMPFFSRLLSTCTHLQTLKMPKIKKENAPVFMIGFNYCIHDGDSFRALVVTPLLDTIAQGRLRSVEVLPSFLDKQQRLRLALVCRESGTLLRGFGFMDDLPPEHLLSAVDIIGDLDNLTDAVIRQPLRNVRAIDFNYETFRTFQDRTYAMPSFPRLTSVDLRFRFCDEDALDQSASAMQLFLDRLVKIKRPSVKRLCMEYDSFQRISPLTLCSAFGNLRVLSLRFWEGEDAEWLKLWPLVGRTLVELELEDCPNLSDWGILGNDFTRPAFLQLKQLRKLKYERNIMWPEPESLTDLCFILAFRHMRLRSLDFFQGEGFENCTRVRTQTVKAMRDGPFGETIEHCFVQREDLMNRIDPKDPGWMELIRLAMMAIAETVVSFLDNFE